MAEQRTRRRSKREELIKAGIEEINRNGIAGFSMRQVADACGVSCGAPYKHFGDRNAFIAAVIEYVNDQWREVQQEILARYEGDLRTQIVELCLEYVRFLMDHPHFRSILTLKNDEFDNIYHRLRGEISSPSQQVVDGYREGVGMEGDVFYRKFMLIRAMLFGVIILFDNGELEYHQKAMDALRYNISREFDLP